MDNQKSAQNNLSPQDAMRMASTPEGQQLIRLLKDQGGEQLRSALHQASAGDYTQAKKAISSLLQDPKVQQLLEKMGR